MSYKISGCRDCDPCEDNINPCDDKCYDDCGCLNPTTFDCITKPGTLSAIGITDSMNGKEALQAINDTIADLVFENTPTGSDIYSKVSINDSTSGFLSDKIVKGTAISLATLNGGGNEQIKVGVDIQKLISGDSSNELGLGTDGKLRVIPSTPIIDIVLVKGSGINISGTGPASDPYIISTNPTIDIARTCFDNKWKNLSLVPTGTTSVVYIGGTPQYRYKYDGTIEFRGSATYTISFGAYTSNSRKQIVTIGSVATSCISLLEQNGVADLKGINYIDSPQVGVDQIVQQYGYIIRKNAQNIILEFQSSFSSPTNKTIVVNFEGSFSYPNI